MPKMCAVDRRRCQIREERGGRRAGLQKVVATFERTAIEPEPVEAVFPVAPLFVRPEPQKLPERRRP